MNSAEMSKRIQELNEMKLRIIQTIDEEIEELKKLRNQQMFNEKKDTQEYEDLLNDGFNDEAIGNAE